jgi:2-polyprenyl-3-methyl-5-hydroxy-6-metoxy-1,4-benzoquinol methylase
MRPRRLTSGLTFGVLAWLSESAILVSLASSMGFPISFACSLCALTALNFGIAAPIAVANLVTFEVSLSVGLAGFGVPVTTALAVAAVHHLVQLASVGCLAATFAIARSRRVLPEFLVRTGDKQRAVDYYQRLSNNYDGTATRGLLRLIRDRERRSVLSLCGFGDPSKRTMIDVGCGGGFYALAARRAGMHVSAMDIAPGMVQGMKCQVDEAWLGDIETHDCAQTYDIVICSGVLDFVMQPELAFRNLAGLVAPEGRLVVNAPRTGVTGWIYRLEKRLLRVEVNLFALGWFEQEAEKHGLQLRRFTHPLPTNRALLFERPAIL